MPFPHPAVRSGPIPSWVEERDAIPVPLAPQGALFDLSEDDQLRIDGRRTTHYHESIVAVGSREGLEEAAEWEVAFAPTFERVTIHALEVERLGRREDRLEKARSVVLQPASDRLARIYDDTLTLVLVADDVRIGDRVRFAYSIEGANPVFGGRWHGELALAWETPIVRRTVRVLHRTAEPLVMRVHGTGPQPVVARAGDDWRELRWRLTGFAAPFPEARVPDGWFQEPFVQLSQFPHWSDVVDWALPLYRRESSPEIQALARDLAPGAPAADRLLAAVRFVQDEVRYFAAPVGPASHAPRPSAEVLRRRYGDCKDKSRLLIDLLGELGVAAWPALVASELRGGARAYAPSPSAFDHVIVAARWNEETIWIDPTASLQGGGPGELALAPFDVALEIRPGPGELTEMSELTELTELPPATSRPGTQTVRYVYHFGAAGEPARIEIETSAERFEADSLRRTLAASSSEQLLAGYLDFYRRSGRSLEAVPPGKARAVVDHRATNHVSLHEEYRLFDCLGTAPCELLPLVMAQELEAPPSGPRRAPWKLTPGLHLRETISLHAAPGEPRHFPPVSGRESNPWFDFRVTSEPRPDGLDLHYELRTLASEVAPRDATAFRRALGEARRQLRYPVTGEATTAGSGSRLPLIVAVVVALLAVGLALRGIISRRNVD